MFTEIHWLKKKLGEGKAFKMLGCTKKKVLRMFWEVDQSLLTGPSLMEKQTSHIIRGGDSFTKWSQVPTIVRFLFSHRN